MKGSLCSDKTQIFFYIHFILCFIFFFLNPVFPVTCRGLADLNKDGKMDRLEFSIAMKLIKLKLQGTPLPSTLPVIMKQSPVSIPGLNNHNPAYGML